MESDSESLDFSEAPPALQADAPSESHEEPVSLPFLRERAAEDQGPVYRLFTSWSVGVATFVGTPAAGGLILAINYWRMRRRFAALTAVLAGAGLTAGLAVLCVLFARVHGGLRVAAPLTLMGLFFVAGTLTTVAEILQGREVRRHELAAGKLSSHWTAFGAAVLLTVAGCVVAWQVLRALHEAGDLCAAGRAAFQRGDRRQAEELLSRAIRLQPTLGEAWLYRAMARAADGRCQAAAGDFAKAVELLPDEPKPLLECGRNKLRLGDCDGAVADLTGLIARAPTAEALYVRAQAWLRGGRALEAAGDCTLALRLETRREFFLLRAECYDLLGKPELANLDRGCAETEPEAAAP